MTIVPPKKLQYLLRLYKSNNFEDLVKATTYLIVAHPNVAQLHNILAVAQSEKGNLQAAERAFRRALELEPNNAEIHNNLGTLSERQGNHAFASESYQTAIKLDSSYVDAILNLGHLYFMAGRLLESEKLVRQAIRLDTKNFRAHSNMGSVLTKQGHLHEAISSCDEAIKLAPNYAEAHNNLGTAQLRLGQYEDAKTSFEQAVKLKPEYPDAIYNLGMCLYEAGYLDDALLNFQLAVSMRPTFFEAQLGLGNTFKLLGKNRFAIYRYERAIEINPSSATCWYNLAQALRSDEKIEPAIHATQKALELNPNYYSAQLLNLHLLAKICDWTAIDILKKKLVQPNASQDIPPPLTMLALTDNPEDELRHATQFATRKFGCVIPLEFAREQKSKQTITLAYFSSDFGDHPVGRLMARVFESHDRDIYTVIGFSNLRDADSMHLSRLQQLFDRFHDISELNDAQASEIVRDEGVDIAIDLSGYTKGSRTSLFAKRIAPIQVNYLGYPGTMGTNFMDYIIADRALIPPNNKKYFTEKVVYLPNCYQARDDSVKVSTEQITRDMFNLPIDDFVFCCFNNTYKISSKEFGLWMFLLSKIPKSVIWILKTNERMVENMKREALKNGIEDHRIIFTSGASYEVYLARLKLADLYLDTFNYNAGATAGDILRVGLPLLTLRGHTYTSRMASSLLEAVELPELIVSTEKAYVDRALELAQDWRKIRQVKEKLLANLNTTSFFNTNEFTKDLENAYKTMIAEQKY